MKIEHGKVIIDGRIVGISHPNFTDNTIQFTDDTNTSFLVNIETIIRLHSIIEWELNITGKDFDQLQ